MIETVNLGYRYPSATRPAVSGVTLSFERGARVVLTGRSGSGKTTLLRLIAGLLQRHGLGEQSGTVRIDGEDPAGWASSRRPEALGWVGQVPSDQLVAGTLADEIAFGPENARWDPARIEARVLEMVAAVGLDVEVDRSPFALSGGQQQRLAIASALAGEADVLCLDEPLAQLDGQGARQVLDTLARVSERGTTVVLVEHRLELVWPWAERVIALQGGQMVEDHAPGPRWSPILTDLGLQVPGHLLMDNATPPGPRTPSDPGDVILSLDALNRQIDGRRILAVEHLAIHAGECLAILGANGAGKSTLLDAIASEAGDVSVVDVPQDPDLALFTPSVDEELRSGGGHPQDLAEDLRLSEVLDRPPQSLSRGQRLRVAVGAALGASPQILLLDEPTSGQDRDAVRRVMAAVRKAECAVVMATHDVDLVLELADRVLILAKGVVVDEGPTEEVLARLPEDGPIRLPEVAASCKTRGWPLVATSVMEGR